MSAPPAEAGPPPEFGRRGVAPVRLEHRLGSTLAEVGPAVTAVIGGARARCPGLQEDDEAAEDLALCLAEILTNCVRHAYGGRPGQPIRVRLVSDGRLARLEVRHRGAPPAPALLAAPAPASPRSAPLGALPERGWGWAIIRGLGDRIRLASEDGWNLLAVEKRLAR